MILSYLGGYKYFFPRKLLNCFSNKNLRITMTVTFSSIYVSISHSDCILNMFYAFLFFSCSIILRNTNIISSQSKNWNFCSIKKFFISHECNTNCIVYLCSENIRFPSLLYLTTVYKKECSFQQKTQNLYIRISCEDTAKEV